MSWGHGEDKFKRMLPSILQGKTRGKKTLWENPSGNPKIKIKTSSCKKMKRGDYGESLGGEEVPAEERLRGKREWS